MKLLQGFALASQTRSETAALPQRRLRLVQELRAVAPHDGESLPGHLGALAAGYRGLLLGARPLS